MKVKLFENVEIGDEVEFWNSDGMIERCVVNGVFENKFTLLGMTMWVNNHGVKCFDDFIYRFFKTGTKTHSGYTYGNAIKIAMKNR